MTKKFSSYVDSDFLIRFGKLKDGLDPEDQDDRIDIWRKLYGFYKSKSSIELSLKRQNLKRLPYDKEFALLHYYLNLHSSGNPSVTLSNNKKPSHPLKHQFVFSDDDSLKGIESAFGINYCDSQNILVEGAKFFNSYKMAVEGKKHDVQKSGGWHNIDIPRHPCNAMIIADNYLLGNIYNLENNLKFIFDKLIPKQELDIDFDITIFSYLFYPCKTADNKQAEPTIEDLKRVEEDILKLLRKKPNYNKVNLSIIQLTDKKDYHERHIFTNSFVLNSGNSFSYFGKNGKPILPSDTTLDIDPLPADNNDEYYAITYTLFVKDLKEIMLKSNVFTGTKKNRLFDFFLNVDK